MFEIGNTLREARTRRRIDLTLAEADTKIRSKYLAALEQEAFDVLPGAVYTRGFLRTYARYLGLDPQPYVDEYNDRFARFEEAEEAVSTQSVGRIGQPRRMPSLRSIFIVSLLLLAVVVWAGIAMSDDQNTPKEQATTSAESNATKKFESEAVETGGTDRIANTGNAAAVAEGAPPKLKISADGGASWIEVRKGSRGGAVLFSGQIEDGKTKTFSAPRLYVMLGMPNVVTLTRGEAEAVGTGTDVANFLVTRSSIEPTE
jgi:cytoskeletal protein RodZ